MFPKERREGATVFAGHPLGPLGLGKYLLKEEGVDVDEGGLEQTKSTIAHRIAAAERGRN